MLRELAIQEIKLKRQIEVLSYKVLNWVDSE